MIEMEYAGFDIQPCVHNNNISILQQHPRVR